LQITRARSDEAFIFTNLGEIMASRNLRVRFNEKKEFSLLLWPDVDTSQVKRLGRNIKRASIRTTHNIAQTLRAINKRLPSIERYQKFNGIPFERIADVKIRENRKSYTEKRYRCLECFEIRDEEQAYAHASMHVRNANYR
jgi:hypothetical protein